MKRYLMAALGMVLLGTAGLIILHQVVESPPPALSQGIGGPAPGPAPGPAGPAGDYKEIVPALVDALVDSDAAVRQLAAATLVQVGPDAVPPLAEALKSEDRETRANAAYVLGRLGEQAPEALPALARALKDDDKEVRRRAAYAIHNIVSRSEAVARGAFSPEGSSAGPPMPGMPAPADPGLLVPAARSEKEQKPEKEQKKE